MELVPLACEDGLYIAFSICFYKTCSNDDLKFYLKVMYDPKENLVLRNPSVKYIAYGATLLF